MRLKLSPAAARRAALPAAALHAFCALALQAPSPGGAAWLSALIGTLLALPALVFTARIGKGRGSSGIFCAALLLLTLGSAALAEGWITASGTFLALDSLRPLLLVAPGCLAALWCVSRGGDALGGGATVMVKLTPALIAPILLIQLPCLRAAWLFPILGSGPRAVMIDALRVAAALLSAYLPAAFLADREDSSCSRRWAGGILASGLAAAAALLLQRMMAPALTGSAASLAQNRLDALLTNGRAPLYLQLPLLALWFAALIHALAFDSLCAAAFLQRLLPRLDGRVCGAIAILAAFALCAAQSPQIARETPIWNGLAGAATVGAMLGGLLPEKAAVTGGRAI